MLQNIIATEKHNSCVVHTLADGGLLVAAKVSLFDEESVDLLTYQYLLKDFLKEMPDSFNFRAFFRSGFSNNTSAIHSRHEAIKELGFVKNELILMLEEKPRLHFNIGHQKKNLERNYNKIVELGKFQVFLDMGLKVNWLEDKEIRELYSFASEKPDHRHQTIDFGSNVTSVLRIVRPPVDDLDFKTLSQIKDSLPLPYILSLNVRPLSNEVSEAWLRRRSKQSQISTDLKEQQKFIEAQEDLREVTLEGRKLFKFEFLCILTRGSEEILRHDREEVFRKLRILGDVYIESYGAAQSLKAMMPGEPQHLGIAEKDNNIPSYIPAVTRGDSELNLMPSSLVLHRLDDSISSLNIFDPKADSYSWVIFGKPGTGKSVLANALTRSLMNDPNIKIIKIDVGGSHSRETKLLGGVEKTLNLNEPTGLNPFLVLQELGTNKDAIQILTSFVEVLILDENELKLPKSEKAKLESAIFEFAESKSELSLQGFYDFAKLCPRRNFLERWVGNGVYSNAFKIVPSLPVSSSRLLYYNFSKISQAQDPDYAQGGLAAVMAQFNMEMLKKSSDNMRIAFFADEVPFFIKKCFNFFNLSIANIRKEGHAFITIAQNSAQVVVNDDTSIIDLSPNRLYFSVDGEEEKFARRNNLLDETVDKIRALKRNQGEFSEVLLKTNKGEKILKIKLSKKEYWSYTSKDEDKQKLEVLRKMCPGLSEEQIIECLTH